MKTHKFWQLKLWFPFLTFASEKASRFRVFLTLSSIISIGEFNLLAYHLAFTKCENTIYISSAFVVSLEYRENLVNSSTKHSQT
jgi:hypothetical protein